MFIAGLATPTIIFSSASYVPISSSLQIICNVGGFPQPYFLWFKDEVLLTNSTESTLSIDEITFQDRGSYHCAALNAFGRKESERKELDVWCKF